MQTAGINPSPYSFYPSTSPSMPYGQVQNPYVPTPSYQPPTVPSPSQNPQMNQIRPQGILGRMITNPNEITPQEIPMDGSISMFPMQDGSAVYGKFWDSNGQIKTIRFVPENTDQGQMKDYANEHLMETIGTLKEIWEDADPDLRKRMKTDLTKLTAEMTV